MSAKYFYIIKKYWFQTSLIGLNIAVWFFVLPFLFTKTMVPQARAVGTTYTVCASGCDFTTLTSAFASSSVVSGDTLQVGATYSSSSETFQLVTPTTSLTIDCQNSGAVIGSQSDANRSFRLKANTTVQNCNFGLITLQAEGDNILITGNTFSDNVTSTITSNGTVSNLVVSNNLNLDTIGFNSPVQVNFTSNTLHFYHLYSPGNGVSAFFSGGDITFTSNTVVGYYTADPHHLIYGTFNTATFIGNTFSIDASITAVNGNFIETRATTTLVSGNTFIGRSFGATSTIGAVNIYGINPNSTADISHNIFILPPNSGSNSNTGLNLADNPSSGGSLYATATYNIFYGGGSGATRSHGIGVGRWIATSTIVSYSDYNGYWGLASNIGDVYNLNTLGGHDRTSNPYFMDRDSDPNNNYTLAPFSNYLDVNGNTDIGNGADQARRSTITISASGAVDYASVDSTSTSYIVDGFRNGDVVSIAAGVYDGMSITSTVDLTGNLTIVGGGGSTVMSAAFPSSSVFSVSNITSSSFSNFVVQDAASSSVSYLMSQAIYSYNGNRYGDSVGGGVDRPLMVTNNITCDTINIDSDNADVGAVVTGSNNVHLALVRIDGLSGERVAIYSPDTMFSSQASFESGCFSGYSVVVERWVTSTFSASGGQYTYNSAAIAAAGVTLESGFTSPPYLRTGVTGGGSGIRIFTSSTGLTFTNITSTNNGIGIYFDGSSVDNALYESVLTGNTGVDVYSSSSRNNALYNVSFNTASTSVSRRGNVSAYFKTRALVQTTTSTALAGVSVTTTAANTSSVTNLITGVDGYTAYTDYLLSFVMTSSSLAVTNGGHNPFTVSAGATSTFAASSTATNITSRNQLVTLSVSLASVVPTNLTAVATGGTTVMVSWQGSSPEYYVEDTTLGTNSGWIAATTKTFVNLKCGSVHTYRVKGRSAGLVETDFTNTVSVTTAQCGGSPSLNPTPAPAPVITTTPQVIPTTTPMLTPTITTPPVVVPVVSPTGDTTLPIKSEITPSISLSEPCPPLLTRPIEYGSNNDSGEVKKLEEFLNTFFGERLAVDGVYDKQDVEAVKRFQSKFSSEILYMWGLRKPTGYVYKTTIAKINTLHCNYQISCPQFVEYNNYAKKLNTNSLEIQSTKTVLNTLGLYDGPINTIFDAALFKSLISFQETFRTVILDPWGLTKGTGYKYKTTNKYLNILVGCDTPPVTLEGKGTFDY